MKSKYWGLLLGAVLIVCLAASLFLMRGTDPADRAEIRSGGELVRVVDLHVDQEFTVSSPDGGSNTITVKDGKIAVTDADCPDGYCMERGFCDSGVQIVCLPHRLVITFLSESEIDAAVG